MEALFEIIKTMSCANANVNPTEIYNEGWMTRLLMYYSVKEEIAYKNIGIELDGTFKDKNWTSEALISSPFVSAKLKREGYTHADIILGDFDVNFEKRGEVTVHDSAEVFGIIEAKMRSPLSRRTSNAPNYNQASRNIVCIAKNTNENCKTFFMVVAPKIKIKLLENQVVKTLIKKQIEERFELHNQNNPEKLAINESEIKKRAEKCKIGVISYEGWLKEFKGKKYYKSLKDFYINCMEFNKITRPKN